MDYISKIFDRLSLNQISHFLLYGAESWDSGEDVLSYQERIKNAEVAIHELLAENLSRKKDCEAIGNKLAAHIGDTQDAYMQIGMQCGAILAMQLLSR